MRQELYESRKNVVFKDLTNKNIFILPTENLPDSSDRLEHNLIACAREVFGELREIWYVWFVESVQVVLDYMRRYLFSNSIATWHDVDRVLDKNELL